MNSRIFLLRTVALVLAAGSAYAQDDEQALDEVVVTGSHIATGVESTSPVLMIDAERLVEVPRASLGDYFHADVTANISYETALDEGTEQGRLDGTRNSAINLRGLGKENTLVLIDGQRTVEYAVVDGNGWRAVDINTVIPRIALKRVEVLLDGGSALYGTDAVAGVVNLIPNYDFEGFRLHAATNRFSEASDKAGDTYSMMFGANGVTTRMVGAVEYIIRDRVSDIDLGHKSFAESLADGPGGATTFTNGPGRRDPAVVDPLCGNAADLGVDPVFAGAVVGSGCGFYDVNPLFLQQETESINTFVGLEHSFSDQLTLSLSGSYGTQDITSYPQYSSVFSFDSNGDSLAPAAQLVGVPDFHPAVQYYATTYPTSDFASLQPGDLLYSANMPMMNYRGEAKTDHDVRTTRLHAKLEFELSEDWSLLGYATYGNSDVTAYRHDAIPGNVEAALNGFGGPDCNAAAGTPGANGCEWFNPFMSSALEGVDFNGVPLQNSQQLLDWIYPQSVREHTGRLKTYQLMVSGRFSAIELGGGALGAALGVERREETLKANFDNLLNNGGYGSFKGVLTPDYNGSSEVDAVFFELGLPVLENLNFQLAGRFEDYGGGLDTFNEKIGVNWGVTEDLVVRASYGTSFKAPTIYQTQATAFIDPGWGSAGDPADADYVGGFGGGTSRALLNEIIAPNPDLEPQESENWSVGFDWNITDNVSLGLNYVSIDFENIIYIPSPTQMFRLSVCNQGTTSPANPTPDGIHPHFIPVGGFPCFELDPSAIPPGSTYQDEVEVGRSANSFRDAYFNGVYISPNNLAFRNIEAVDIDFRWTVETGIGEFTVHPQATILLQYDEQIDPAGEVLDYVGQARTFGGGYSEYRVNVPFELRRDDHAVKLTGRYISALDPIIPGTVTQTFGSYTQFDLNWLWNINDSYRVSVFVNNVSDEVPDNQAPSQFPRGGRTVGLQFEMNLGN